MGVPPMIWGPYAWGYLHLMTQGLPEKISPAQQQSLQTWFPEFLKNLPCPGCSIHASHYIKTHPFAPTTREEMETYLIDFQNSVNKRNGKTELTHEEARAKIRENYLDIREWKGVFGHHQRQKAAQTQWDVEKQQLETQLARAREELPHWALVVFLVAGGIAALLTLVSLGLIWRAFT